jgi:hypothetical protein
MELFYLMYLMLGIGFGVAIAEREISKKSWWLIIFWIIILCIFLWPLIIGYWLGSNLMNDEQDV